MSTNVDVWNAVLAKIRAAQASGQPLSFVKSVFEGARENINALAFPAIMVEPDDDPEDALSMPAGITGTFKLTITCGIHVFDADKQIVGAGNVIGILPFVDAVRNVITTDRRLGIPAIVQKAKFTGCRYFFQNFPIRQADLTLEIQTIKTVSGR